MGRGLTLNISNKCFCAPWSRVLAGQGVVISPFFVLLGSEYESGKAPAGWHVSSHCAPWSRVPACGQGVDIGVSWDGCLPHYLIYCVPLGREYQSMGFG